MTGGRMEEGLNQRRRINAAVSWLDGRLDEREMSLVSLQTSAKHSADGFDDGVRTVVEE